MLLGMKFVERAFDRDDWFVIISCVVFNGIAVLLPKKLPGRTVCLLVMYGLAVSSLLDNSTGYLAFDFYDIMDGPKLTVMDYVVYLLYAPFGYLFIYFYLTLNVKGWGTVAYILLFSAASVGFEWVCYKFGVFHYKHGYRIFFSFVIYLYVQTAAVIFYHYIKEK